MVSKKTVPQQEKLIKNYFKYHYVVLQLFGVWIDSPESSSVNLIFNVYAVFVVGLFFVLYTIFEIMYIHQNFVDIYSMAFQLTYSITHVLGLFKMALLFLSRKNIKSFGQTLESGIFVPDVKRGGIKEIRLINTATKIANYQATFFYSSLLIMLSLYVLNAIINNDSIQQYYDPILNETIERHVRLTPYTCWLPFETIETPYYEIASSYQVISDLFFGFQIGASDTLICAILCHIKAQLLLLINSLETYMDRMEVLMKDDGLKVDLRKFRERNDESNEQFPKYIQKYATKCINDCISHHQQIIDLAKEAEATFSYLMLVQFLGSVLLICFQLFQLSVSSLTSYDSISMICYLLLAMFQVLIFCYHGNEIMLVSDSLPQKIYEINWMVTDIPTKKSLLIMMTGAYRPIRMTAGKFAFLSLETFVSIIRGSGSYFMVLRSMNEEE